MSQRPRGRAVACIVRSLDVLRQATPRASSPAARYNRRNCNVICFTLIIKSSRFSLRSDILIFLFDLL